LENGIVRRGDVSNRNILASNLTRTRYIDNTATGSRCYESSERLPTPLRNQPESPKCVRITIQPFWCTVGWDAPLLICRGGLRCPDSRRACSGRVSDSPKSLDVLLHRLAYRPRSNALAYHSYTYCAAYLVSRYYEPLVATYIDTPRHMLQAGTPAASPHQDTKVISCCAICHSFRRREASGILCPTTQVQSRSHLGSFRNEMRKALAFLFFCSILSPVFHRWYGDPSPLTNNGSLVRFL
jgi:hypothetical protein